MHLLGKHFFFRRKLKNLRFPAVSLFSRTFKNFFENHLPCYLSHLLLVHLLKKIFFSKTRHLWFSQFDYSTVSILSTNKLVYILSTCSLSVMFLCNHCCTTIVMYSHFLFLPESQIQSINPAAINQFFKKKIFWLPTFPHHLSLALCTPSILAFNPYML